MTEVDIQLANEPGWSGAFTRHQAANALPNGARVVKVKVEIGDANPVGALGTVLGSISHPEVGGGQPFYFLEWDSTPRVAVACIGWKIEQVQRDGND